METPIIPGLQTFLKKWLSPSPGRDSISLDQWVHELAPGNQEDLLLQMDIEGAEYENLLACSDSTLRRFRIIVIELHSLGEEFQAPKYEHRLKPLLHRLHSLFTCVHAHPNNCCGEFLLDDTSLVIPNFIELTFLRNNRIITSSRDSFNKVFLPHPLDITCMIENPPLFLEGEWLVGNQRELESQINILQSQVQYLDYSLSIHKNNQAKLTNDISALRSLILELRSMGHFPRRFSKLVKTFLIYFNKRLLRTGKN
jgi:hypothetical protein